MSAREPLPTILLVDSEQANAKSLSYKLDKLGYRLQIVHSGNDALTQLKAHTFDLVLLDLYMPDIDGLQVLTVAQKLAPDTIFVILTAFGTLDSAVTALRQGAFDYLLKSCPVNDVIETVQRGLQKRQKLKQQKQLIGLLREALADISVDGKRFVMTRDAASRLVSMGAITLDTQWRAAIVEGKLVRLSATEYKIMTCFAQTPNQALSCQELVKHTHKVAMDEQDARSIIRMHIYRLRRKLEPDPNNPRYIRSVRGVGYIFIQDPDRDPL